MGIPWWTWVGAGATSAGMWAGAIYLGYRAWENPVIRTGIKIGVSGFIPG